MRVCVAASLWRLCQNAVRAQNASDPTTWLTSPAAAAPITPAPLRMRMTRRGGKQEEGERGRRRRKRFLTTLETVRRNTGLNAQVKQHCFVFIFLKTGLHIFIFLNLVIYLFIPLAKVNSCQNTLLQIKSFYGLKNSRHTECFSYRHHHHVNLVLRWSRQVPVIHTDDCRKSPSSHKREKTALYSAVSLGEKKNLWFHCRLLISLAKSEDYLCTWQAHERIWTVCERVSVQRSSYPAKLYSIPNHQD